jgi:hypothetical protein
MVLSYETRQNYDCQLYSLRVFKFICVTSAILSTCCSTEIANFRIHIVIRITDVWNEVERDCRKYVEINVMPSLISRYKSEINCGTLTTTQFFKRSSV